MKFRRGTRSLVIGIVMAAVVATALSAGQTTPPPVRPDIDIKAVETFIAKRIQAGEMVGVSLAAARDGKIVLARGFGRARAAEESPVTPETMFAVGSVTKQFTAACVLLLAEDGKLAVTDKVSKYYPDLTRAGDITLLDLLNHVSGYPDYYPLDFVDRRMLTPVSADEVIRRYAMGALDFEPGSRFSYSNTGYLILGRIVEKISGGPFAAFLSKRILVPLGLKHTAYKPDPRSPGLAAGHGTFALSLPQPAASEAADWIAMAGAMFSTAGDLVRWDLALNGGKVLKPESYKIMTAPRRLSDGAISNYACGLAPGERNGTLFIAHNGAVSGFYAFNLAVPSTGSALSVLINLDGGGPISGLIRLILPGLFPAPPPMKPAEAKAAAAPAPVAKPATVLPTIAGPGAAETAKTLFLALQAGAIDRNKLGAEFSWWLTDEKISGAATRLKPCGAPSSATVISTAERGGMEVSTTELKFAGGKALRTLMYRTPDGLVQEFFVSKN